ncbi:MAG: hypothetical protein KF861_09285 [Planctomycetaceae bacterium]|nr:hypothetical protein [Planctomycetaceae bacterium]
METPAAAVVSAAVVVEGAVDSAAGAALGWEAVADSAEARGPAAGSAAEAHARVMVVGVRARRRSVLLAEVVRASCPARDRQRGVGQHNCPAAVLAPAPARLSCLADVPVWLVERRVSLREADRKLAIALRNSRREEVVQTSARAPRNFRQEVPAPGVVLVLPLLRCRRRGLT